MQQQPHCIIELPLDVLLVGHGIGELLFSVRLGQGDALLFSLEQIDWDGVLVVRLEQLAALGIEVCQPPWSTATKPNPTCTTYSTAKPRSSPA